MSSGSDPTRHLKRLSPRLTILPPTTARSSYDSCVASAVFIVFVCLHISYRMGRYLRREERHKKEEKRPTWLFGLRSRTASRKGSLRCLPCLPILPAAASSLRTTTAAAATTDVRTAASLLPTAADAVPPTDDLADGFVTFADQHIDRSREGRAAVARCRNGVQELQVAARV